MVVGDDEYSCRPIRMSWKGAPHHWKSIGQLGYHSSGNARKEQSTVGAQRREVEGLQGKL